MSKREAIEKLEEALKIKGQISPDYTEETIKWAADLMMVHIEDALTILRDQPPASELTKKVRLSVQDYGSVISKITDVRLLSIIGWIPQLCDRLDASEAENKSQAHHIELLNQCDDTSTETIAKMDDEIKALEASRKELVEALEPFTKLADMIPEPDAPDFEWRRFNTKLNMLSLDYLRAAKAAIEKQS